MIEALQVNFPGAHLEVKIALPSRGSRLKAGSRRLRFICHPCVGRDPVHFPSLASIVREGLLKTARIRRDVRYNEPNKDGSAIQCFLVVEFAASILELADRGLAQSAVVAVGKIEAPLVGLWIVEAQVQTFEVPLLAIGLELQQIGASIPNLSNDGSSVKFNPGGGASERMHQAPEVSFPSTKLEVEIVLAVPFCWSVLVACARCI